MRKRILALAAWATLATAQADPMYVIEQLVVNVNSDPTGAGERVATLKSGEQVEVLDKQKDATHIRLKDGREGWIKSTYLMTQPPLAQRLAEQTAKSQQLEQEVSRLQSQLATNQPQLADSQGQRAGADSSSSATTTANSNIGASSQSETTESPTDGTHGGSAAFFQTPIDPPPHPVWHWVLGSAIICLALGFVLGWVTLDRRIRRKYGGLRIY